MTSLRNTFVVSALFCAALSPAWPQAVTPRPYGHADGRTGAMVKPAAPTGPSSRQIARKLAYLVAQGGGRSGITNTLYTDWLPPGRALAALSGTVSLAGSTSGFSEALVTVGTTTSDSQAACEAGNASWPSQTPSVRRLWVGILKDNGTGNVAIPVDLALPHEAALPGTAAGTCLATLVSAGYPFLDRVSARYTRITVNLTATIGDAPPHSPTILPFGLGGEFKLDTASGPDAYALVALRAATRLQVDGIAGSVSAAAVTGAPSGSGWTPMPAGAWTIGTVFTYMPAATCQAAGLIFPASHGLVAVVRRGTPSPFSFPAGSHAVMSLPLQGFATLPLQSSRFQGFADATHLGASVPTLAPGDCLIEVQHMLSAATSIPGPIDYENQSTVYLRPPP